METTTKTRRESVNAIQELARRSGQWLSMNPDRWGETMLNQLEDELTEFLEQVPEEMKAELETAYISRYSEWLRAMSRCFSAMITGGAGFNSRRHNQRNAAEHAARQRLEEWRERTIKRVNRQQRLTGWAEVERLEQKLEQLKDLQEKMKAANKIVRDKKMTDEEKIDELISQLGVKEETAKEINAEPEYAFMSKGFAPYQLSNNLAKIKDTEQAIKRHTMLAESEDTETEYTWGKVVRCCSDERLRFLFNDMPSAEVRMMMKRHGFKWSPSNQAWQRQLTRNAEWVAKSLIEELNKAN